MVDTPLVVCRDATPPSPGFVNIQVPLDSIRAANLQNTPHVFTFYRTSPKATSVSFKVVDATGKTVVEQRTADLTELARRLDVQLYDAVAAEGAEDNVQLREEDYKHAEARQISARRRRMGGRSSYRSSSASRGRTGSGIKRESRRRTPGHGNVKQGSSSPRASSSSVRSATKGRTASSRRRGAPQATNQPAAGVGGSRYTSANGQGYGYTKPQALSRNYPSGYQSTGYGYSGMNAYTPGAGGAGNVMMAVAGGALLGVGASYLYSRWNSYDSCAFGSSWTGSCSDCYSSFSREQCQITPPRVGAHRDDLMKTGFWPDDFTSPLTVTISSIYGMDFSSDSLCQPASSNVTTLGKRPSDLFLALTKVDELSDTMGDGALEGAPLGQAQGANSMNSSSFGAPFTLVVIALCLCCGMGPVLAKILHKKHEDEDDFDSTAREHTPVIMGQPVVQDRVGRRRPSHASEGCFMDTIAPCGETWQDYCLGQPVDIDHETGTLRGHWGECMAWAKVYEAEHPEWANDPRYALDGPCGQVISALVYAAGNRSEEAEHAADEFESECEVCIAGGRPIPLIEYVVHVV